MNFRRLPEDACARSSARRLADRTSRAARSLLRNAAQDAAFHPIVAWIVVVATRYTSVGRGPAACNLQRTLWFHKRGPHAIRISCAAHLVTRLRTTPLENA